MTRSVDSSWPAPVRRWDALIAMLRIALGSVFVIAGTKGVMPGLFGFSDRTDFVAKFVDPVTGFLAPWLVERLTDFGISVGVVLLVLSIIEIVMGLVLVAGLGTRMVAFGLAVMLWSFTVAAPEAGAIRLARDVALIALCGALVYAGGGRWSLDRRLAVTLGLTPVNTGGTGSAGRGFPRRVASRLFGDATLPPGRRDPILLAIRLGLAFPMLTSVVFTGGVFDNPMNTTLPVAAVGFLGVLLATGVAPRWVMVPVALWMGWLVVVDLVTKGLFVGFDDSKRELALFAAAVVYLVAGPDRWSLPKPDRIHCRDVSDILLAYVDKTLDVPRRSSLEEHFADCPDCWRYFEAYRQTIALGRQLRDESMPAAVRERLDFFVRTSLR